MKQVKSKLPVRMLTLLLGLFLSVNAFAQSVAVKGNVTDATGEPIIGATVRVDGQNGAGTVTDIDGNFRINAPKGSTLSVSYIGYLVQKVAASPSVNVTLKEDNKTLNEVVVIGYGSVKKSDATGSVTAIKPDEMNHGLQTNAQDMIAGKIAGVSVISNSGAPGASSTIRIRGGSSLNASNDPLIVIDGLAMDSYGIQGLSNPLSMVNPNDIESFTVLKDASATAIYGSRASNGVIIITTKKGKAGTAPKVSYNGNISISHKKSTIDVLDGNEYKDFIANLYGENSDAYKALGYTDANGVKQYANTDWQDQIYRTAVSTDQNVTVTGGLKNMPYRASLGWTEQPGILKTSCFERFTGSFNVSPTLFKDHLHLNINGKGMWAKNRYADTGAIGAALYMDPTKPVTLAGVAGDDTDAGIYNKYFGGYSQWYQGASFELSSWKQTANSNGTANPVALLRQKNDRAISRSLVGNFEADLAVPGFEDLHLHVNGGMDLSTGRQNTGISPYSKSNNYYGWDGWNTMDTYNLSLSTFAQYKKEIAKIHNIDVMAGYEWQHFHKSTDWNGNGIYPNESNGHYFWNWETGKEFNVPTSTTLYKTENYLVSFYGRMNYSLMERYLLTFTLRDDGSSRFNKDNRWGIFPSVALAWRVIDEPIFKKQSVMSDLKLRAGWGITGQQEGIGDYTYIPTYTPNISHAYYNIGLTSDGITYRPDAYNPDLTWEKTTTWNAGIDFGFLNNRITASADWYYRKTRDLINTVYVSAGSNFKNQVTSNIGSLHNTGAEFSITARPIQSKDWRWEVNYNVTYNKNRIDELTSGSGNNYYVETGGISAGTGGTIQAHAVGHAASAFYVYQQVYDKSGNPIPNTYVDRNGNGTIDSGDRYFYYKPAADFLMGFGSKLEWKNLDFSFNCRASLGNYVYNNVAAGSCNVGAGSVYALGYLGNRQKDAVSLGFTNPLTEQFFSDYWVENASFFKLDNITLGYSFQKLFRENISGRAYVTAQNVFTITNYSGIDPEVSGGIDNNMYPRPFTLILGLNLNF